MSFAPRCICGAPLPGPRRRRCDECRRASKRRRERRRRARMSPAQRGYGAEHRRLRRRWQPIVDAGRAVCSRCGEPIAAGADWDLGHDDVDRSRYTGPEHPACNRATAGRPRRRHSRRW